MPTNQRTPASPIDNISSVSGDVIGRHTLVGIDGSGNIIGKNISIVLNKAQSYGMLNIPSGSEM
jgi:hypothetical protein